MAEFFDGVAIFAILIADEDDAVNRKFGSVKSGECEQCVIDGTEAAASGENYRKLEFHHHVEHELFRIDGNENTASTFDDEPVVHQSGGKSNAVEIDFNASPARGKIG